MICFYTVTIVAIDHISNRYIPISAIVIHRRSVLYIVGWPRIGGLHHRLVLRGREVPGSRSGQHSAQFSAVCFVPRTPDACKRGLHRLLPVQRIFFRRGKTNAFFFTLAE